MRLKYIDHLPTQEQYLQNAKQNVYIREMWTDSDKWTLTLYNTVQNMAKSFSYWQHES